MSTTRGQESDDRAHGHSKTPNARLSSNTCGSCLILVRSGIVTLRSTMVHFGLALFNDRAVRKPQEGRPFCPALEELLGIPRDFQQPDPLRDVVPVRDPFAPAQLAE